jgi:reactive chlorine resistance protein C
MAMARGTTSANARVVPGGRSPTIRTERIRMTTNQSTSSSGRILQLSTIDNVAAFLGRYGLVVVIGWIGGLKFAHFEANQIQPLVAHSPFMGWLYNIFSVYTFSALLGVFEVTAAVLLAIKPWFPKLAVVGSVQAVILFLATISFLFTTPGIGEPAGGGFPALSLIGEFLLKDIPLLGLSFWTLADALRAVKSRSGLL